jgi:hypothetical protein
VLQSVPRRLRAPAIFPFSAFQSFPASRRRERGEQLFRTSDIVLIAVMVSAAALTYKTKREAEEQLAAVQKIQAQIRYEEDTIDLLKADWSLLTQPERLQKLTELYQPQLELEPVGARQIVGLDALPPRVLTIENLTAERFDLGPDIGGPDDGGLAGKDPIKTGGIQ